MRTNQFKVGDTVRIIECAPISKSKRWTVLAAEAAERLIRNLSKPRDLFPQVGSNKHDPDADQSGCR